MEDRAWEVSRNIDSLEPSEKEDEDDIETSKGQFSARKQGMSPTRTGLGKAGKARARVVGRRHIGRNLINSDRRWRAVPSPSESLSDDRDRDFNGRRFGIRARDSLLLC